MMLLLEARPYFVFDQFVFLCHIVYFAFMHSNLNAPLASQHPCHVSIATLELKFNSVFICTKRKLKNSEQQQAKLVAAVEAAVFFLPLLGSALRTSCSSTRLVSGSENAIKSLQKAARQLFPLTFSARALSSP